MLGDHQNKFLYVKEGFRMVFRNKLSDKIVSMVSHCGGAGGSGRIGQRPYFNILFFCHLPLAKYKHEKYLHHIHLKISLYSICEHSVAGEKSVNDELSQPSLLPPPRHSD